ncbi:MAG: DUF485 domain-containing protein [Planctomycetota bacterium]|nr:DUF485 domain-containing protein [Planctomycetota bacterium]
MAHFDSSAPTHKEAFDPATAKRNSRYGVILFFIYTTIYAVFVGINAFAPATMDWIVLFGLNLAVVYGIGLILLAFAMSLLYGWLCRAPASSEESL